MGWMQVVLDDPDVDGDSVDSPSCQSSENIPPGESFDVTGKCVNGVAFFDVFVYDDSAPFRGLSQSDDLGCPFLTTSSGSPGEGIAYYSFEVGCDVVGFCNLIDGADCPAVATREE